MQYENALQHAVQCSDKEALGYYLQAVMAQHSMARMLSGEDAERHNREMYRLLNHMRDEILRLGIEIPDSLRQQMCLFGIELPEKQSVAVNGNTSVPPAVPFDNAAEPGKDQAVKKPATGNDDTLHGFDPASLRFTKVPSESFADFGEMSEEIQGVVASLDTVKKMHAFPKLAEQLADVSPHVLLYGPPGGGKTHFCKAVANYVMTTFENGAFFLVKAGDIRDYLVGVSERRLKALFEEVEKYDMPVVCIDEIDTLCPVRDADSPQYITQLVAEFQQYINGAAGSTKALIIGATNYPWRIEGAILSRLSTHVFVDLPDEKHIRDYLIKRVTPFFGKDQCFVDEMLDMCAKRLENASYRVLAWLWLELGSRAFMKTTADRAPDSNLADFVPLTREEIESVLAQAKIDYNPEYMKRLKNRGLWN